MTDVAQSLSREAHAHEKELRAEHAELFGNARAWRNLAILKPYL
jgi:phosphonate transport system permease protein